MFDANYIKANDPITKRALWIREQRIGKTIQRWAILTDPTWNAPRIINNVKTDFRWEDPGEPLRLMPRWMYWLPIPTKYESPHWNGRLSGTLHIPPLKIRGGEGELWTLTHWPAQEGHLWGWKMSRDWAWAHGNCFVEDHTAAFEILTSGGRTLLCLKSQQFNFVANTAATWRCTRHEITPTHWRWEFAHNDLTISGNFQLGYTSMAEVIYPTPQGDTRHCHNTKVGCGTIIAMRGSIPVLQLTAHDTLAWERVTSNSCHCP